MCSASGEVEVSIRACDLTDPNDDRWRSAIDEVEGKKKKVTPTEPNRSMSVEEGDTVRPLSWRNLL
ncbi:MAG: hypothetical protein CME19_21860 [Gemmatimonadetes bacterium]|nr:hypothetical protein [Gemmatimonadota bacterium]